MLLQTNQTGSAEWLRSIIGVKNRNIYLATCWEERKRRVDFSLQTCPPPTPPFKTKITAEHAWILSKLQKSMSCDICHSLCENIHTFTTSPQYLAADCVHVWNRHVRCNYSVSLQTGRTHAVARCWQTWLAYWPSELWLLLYIFLSTYSIIYVFICTFKVQSLCCVRKIITSNTLSSL